MISKKKKIRKRILDSLSGKAELSIDKGKFVPTKVPLSKKVRRHSGWVTPQIVNKTMKYSEIIQQCLEPQPYWDDWSDWRDSMRANSDTKHIFKKKGRYWKFSNDELKKINKRNKNKLIRKKKLKI